MTHAKYALAFLGLVACTTPENYVHGNGASWCNRYRECAKGSFQSQYSDQEDCVDEYVDNNEAYAKCALEAGCEFKPDNVAECRQAVNEGDCEDFVEGDWYNNCDEFWDCDDDEVIDVAECLIDES